MCGICGLTGNIDRPLVEKMTKALFHRGPDSEGFYFEDEVGLGVRRLRIIDLNTGDQPIHNENNTIWIVFNGEIYNFRELRDSLIKKGHLFYTNTDTEVIVHLYEDYGDDCPKYLRGMFAFAIWDKNEKRLFLVRDRIGIKPLYYNFTNNRFAFASEIKSLLQDNNISREVNSYAIDKYLTFLYIPAPLTIFNNIHKLLPGHTLSFRNGKIEIKKYWQLDFETKKCPQEEYLERIKENLEEVVKLHMVSDVPLGALLSGGLDSSTIVGLMSKVSGKQIETFSIGFEDKFSSYNELEYSTAVAQFFQTKHHQVILKTDILRNLPQIVRFLDEPFADSSAILNYLICQEAKKFVTVALSGVGGDEVFGGYPRYLGAMASRYYDFLPPFLRSCFKGMAGFIPQSRKSQNTGGRLKRFLNAGLLSFEEKYISWISYFSKDSKKELYSEGFKNVLNDDSFDIHRRRLNEINTKDSLDKISYLDFCTYLPDDLLIMSDRMSMANSLEMRVPFCDHKLIEEMARIPFSEKLKGFKLKSLFRKAVKDLLPQKIINKKKQGFMLPLADWISEDLKPYICEVLSEENIKKRGFFNPQYIQRMLELHFNKKELLTHQIWSLFILELWCQNNIDNKL